MGGNLVHFGKKAFLITDAKWDSERQVGIVSFEDDNGIQYTTEALGMRPSEQRDAVFDAVKNAWVNAQADIISGTADKLGATMKQLAIACGNHPYEDGE